jgi:hypothetical protein
LAWLGREQIEALHGGYRRALWNSVKLLDLIGLRGFVMKLIDGGKQSIKMRWWKYILLCVSQDDGGNEKAAIGSHTQRELARRRIYLIAASA